MAYNLLDKKRLHYTMNIFMVIIVIVSILLTILESADSLMTPQLRGLFLSMHLSILMVFFAEFLYRLWSAPEHSNKKNPFLARLSFLINPLTIIDIIVIAPLFMMIWTQDLHDADFVILRLLRFTSLLNIFRFYRSSKIISVLRNLSHQVWYEILIFCIISLQCIVVAGVLFYAVENGHNPQMKSIGDGIWWAIVTLTTIGYGDIYPWTSAGRVIATILGLLGIGLVALPTGILASGFIRALKEEKRLAHLEEEIEEESDDMSERLKRIEKKLNSLNI
jgi:voltage-gated potassium channel